MRKTVLYKDIKSYGGETAVTNRGGDIMSLKDYLESYKLKDEYKKTIDDLKEQVKNAPSSDEITNLKNTIADMEAKEQKRLEDEKAKRDDELLTNNIIAAIGDKQFVNDYTRNAIIEDIKKGLKEENNGAKSAKDLFEEITKDKSDIFANPNKMPDMPGMGDSEESTSKKEMPMVW